MHDEGTGGEHIDLLLDINQDKAASGAHGRMDERSCSAHGSLRRIPSYLDLRLT